METPTLERLPIDAALVDEAIALVAHWLEAAPAFESRAEAKKLALFNELIEDPAGVSFTMGFVDRVARPDDNLVAAKQLRALVQDRALPQFLSPLDRLLLRAGAMLAPRLPAVVMPLARRRMRQLVGHMVVDAELEPLREHLQERRSEGFDLNVNLLGEAVLGEREADRRMQATLGLLAEPDVDYVSVKLSSVVAQLNYWAWDDSKALVQERLIELFEAALASNDTFLNLDMEEYHDLELTVAVFSDVLAMERFDKLDAGIVLQAYLPDSFDALQELVALGNKRAARGGGDIKIRLVKGANLAMEQVEAAMHGWAQAPYATKAETDANYKRLVDWVLTSKRTSGVRVGIGSHNLFDVAFAHLVAAKRGVQDRVEFEMLQGMAPGEAGAVKQDSGSLLLYTPIVGKSEFDVAISYLFRRLEENSAPENFLRILYDLRPRTPAFDAAAQDFREAVVKRGDVGSTPQRSTTRTFDLDAGKATTEFTNAVDSDPALPATRAWAAEVVATVDPTVAPESPMVEDPATIDAAVRVCREAQPSWFDRGGLGRQAILHDVAVRLEAARGPLIATMMGEANKTFDQADVEVSEAVDFARYYGDRAAELEDWQCDVIRFTAVGVIAVVPPWNFPVAIAAGGVLAALAAGNGVVLKPAPETPACAEIVAKCCWGAGVPSEVLQFLRTPDNEIGQRLITSVDGVILTGASETAKMFLGWKPSLRLYAETSGKNSLIVTPSADIDLAVQDLVQSAFGHAGQKCSAASLGILVGDVYDSPRFRSQLLDAVNSLVTGGATDLATVVNPLVGPPSEKLERALTSLEPGERWLVEPRLLKGTENLWTPGVRIGVTPGSWFHQTECFGPVLGLMHAETLEDALAMANGHAFALTGGIHSLDTSEVEEFLQTAEVGNAYVNRAITGAIVQRQPFGGWKRSSVGPGSKAGGPNYVARLGTWTDSSQRDDAWLRTAAASGEHWERDEFGVEHDPTGLFCEANIFRYRPRGPVVLRVGANADAVDVKRVSLAAASCGVELVVSDIAFDPDETFAAQLRPGGRFAGTERVRSVGDVEDCVRRSAAVNDVYLADAPVVGNARIEALHYLHEQAISQTLHRFGNLIR